MKTAVDMGRNRTHLPGIKQAQLADISKSPQLAFGASNHYHQWMTSTGVPVWVPLLVAVIGTLSTVAAVWISARNARVVSIDSDNRRVGLEQRQFERNEVRADQKDLRTAACAFLAEAREYIHGVQDNYREISASSGRLGESVLKQGSLQRIDFKPVYTTYWQIVFVSDKSVSSAARDLLEATRAFDYQYIEGSDQPVLTKSGFEQLRFNHTDARGTFYRAVKTALGS